MITNMNQAREFIQSKRGAGIVYTLDRMNALMIALDHPEKKISAIHIAGTNGKGSTCAFVSSILQEANFDVGAFNTPVFGEDKDQITVNQTPMSEADFVNVCQKIAQVVSIVESQRNEEVSEFECMVAITYYYFAFVHPVDVVLVEAGMGGRLDATNILTSPLATVITNVGKDHQRFLGKQIKDIAQEKAGIIKRGVPHFTASDSREALEQMEQMAVENATDVMSLNDLVTYRTDKINGEQRFTYIKDGEMPKQYTTLLVGEHQTTNASLALFVLNGLADRFQVSEKQKVDGLKNAFVPGRWECIEKYPEIILDCAHNEEAIDTVCALIDRNYRERDLTILFAAMKDKPVKAMFKKLDSLNRPMVLTSFSSNRSMTFKEYQQQLQLNKLKNLWVEDCNTWIKQWRKKAKADDVLIITGSHSFIGECRRVFRTK
ncbi:bifunctional folylpolyglutamate synthase/dihydrofolate synthase [Salipaludibacillus sp. HK11]|uniref:bifunctional folylpolyglutamate synthase/dihydrofolate synthase n=1 Tax=Salipaludibacillus sp. HK11 TaxID=3394320 RepID=UPI0039FD5279